MPLGNLRNTADIIPYFGKREFGDKPRPSGGAQGLAPCHPRGGQGAPAKGTGAKKIASAKGTGAKEIAPAKGGGSFIRFFTSLLGQTERRHLRPLRTRPDSH